MSRRPAPVPRVVDPTLARWWELLVALSTVVSLGLVIFEWGLDRETYAALAEWLRDFDVYVCALFLIDFSIRLYKSEARGTFLRRNWIELLG